MGDFITLGIGRWIHILAGVMWIGLLYYFNFVQVPALADAGKDGTAPGITKHVAPRALFWFRWAALVTWVVGVLWLGWRGTLVEAATFQGPEAIIGMGGWLGTIMAFNVWFIIWPNQRKVLGLVPATVEEKPRAARHAFLASRTNTMLSIPMLFFMGSYSHGTALY